jgi:hypothetical protein
MQWVLHLKHFCINASKSSKKPLAYNRFWLDASFDLMETSSISFIYISTSLQNDKLRKKKSEPKRDTMNCLDKQKA